VSEPLAAIHEPLPKNWSRTRVGDVLSLVNGFAFKPSHWNTEGLPIIRIQNLNNKDAPYNYCTEQLPEKFRVKYGDLLFAWSGTPGTSFGAHIWKGGPAWLNQHIFRVDFSEELFDRRFLQLAINANLVQYIAAAHGGAGLAHITAGKFKDSILLLPPFKEQLGIVAEIDKQFTRLDAAVAALKRVQANLKRYRAAVLKAACEGRLVPTEAELARKEGRSYETGEQLLTRILKERRARWEGDQLAKMRANGKPPQNDHWKKKYREPEPPVANSLPDLPKGWTWASLGQIADIQGGIQKQPSRVPHEHAYPFLRVANVYRGRLDLAEIHQIEVFGDELSKLRLCAGDLLIVEGNGSPTEIGRMAIWKGEIENCVHQNHIIRARLVAGVRPEYCAAYWNSTLGSSEVARVAGSTSGLYTLSVGKVSRIVIPIPPSSEQGRIVEEMERVLTNVGEIEPATVANHQRADRLRQSILKRAFEGKLVPQDPNDEPASVLLERIRAERLSRPVKSKVRTPRSSAPVQLVLGK